MKQQTKTDLQVYTAIAMLACGIMMAVASFCVPPVGEISDSVLWFFAQCLIYAGSIFGVSVYVQTKFEELRDRLARKGD